MRFVKTTLGAMAAVLLCGTGTALASPETMFKANVPFAFEVNGRSMPAGKYIVQRDDESPEVLIIRGADKDNHAIALVSTTPDNGRDPAGSRSALAFKRHESRYQLSSVWQSDGDGLDVVAARPQ
jgi:hypothetical protein